MSEMDGALRAAFGSEPGESVMARLKRTTGVQSRILLHDAPGEESPLLRVGGTGGAGAEDSSRYRIAGEIARGGVGIVYKARDADLGRDVALKVLRREHASNPEVLDRLVEEAQIGGQLQHPGIVPVYGIGLQPDQRPYFAMKLIKGRTLAAVLKERGSPHQDLARFLRVFEQVCQTMAYAHSRGVIHRDLKPSNVMVGGFGDVQVVDWGFGKVLGRNDPMAEKLEERTIVATVRSKGEGSESITGSVMGTPAYMPPEQALGQVETLDERCDVFALGAIFCEILTGEPAYVGAPEDLLTMAAQARLDGAYERLSSCKADPALVRICRDALAPMRADRPENASALAQSLDDFLAAAEKRAREAELLAVHERAQLERERQEALWARRAKRKTMALAAATVAAVLLTGSAWLWRDGRRRDHAAQFREEAQRSVEEATRLLGAERWSEAAAEARRGRDLAAQSDLLATLRDDAEGLAVRAEAAADRVARRDRLCAALDESRMRDADELNLVARDDRYLATFAEAGLDLSRTTADLAEVIRREYPDAIEQIVPALDHLASLRRSERELKERDREQPDALARAIDGDPWRNDIRDAAASKNLERLRALQEQASRLDLPLRTLMTLGLALNEAGDRSAAGAHFVRLRDAHPGDFWVHLEAAEYLIPANTGRWRERAALEQIQLGLECATAAVALRPKSQRAHVRLAKALCARGDVDDAIAAYREAIRMAPDASPATYGNLGIALHEKGDFDGAIAAYREAIRLRPDLAAVHHNLGNALLYRRLPDEAIAAYREAIRLEPDSAPFHCGLGNALADRGPTDEAIAECREAIRLDPGLALAHCSLGFALMQKGRADEAIAACREAIRLAQDSAPAHNTLGGVLAEKGLFDEAIAECREAIRLDPGLASAHSNLGIALARKGRTDEAIAACREALRLQPGFARALVNLGEALGAKGLLDEAIVQYREAIRLDPRNANAHGSLGTALVDKGLVDEGIASLREAIRLRPELARAHSNLSMALRRKGMLDDAIAASREALRLRPDIATIYTNLACALTDKGLLDEAIATCREGIRLDPNFAKLRVNLGWALSLKGLADEAITELREAIRLDPGFGLAHCNLGSSLMQKGRVDEAIAAFREAIRLDPGLALAHHNLGICLLSRGLLDEGNACCREAIRLQPGFATAYLNLGYGLQAKGLVDDAIAAYREAIRLNPDLALAHSNLGNLLLSRGLFDEGIACCREAIRLQPGYATAYLILGRGLQAKGLLDDAIAAYREGLLLEPEAGWGHARLGAALVGKGLLREALEACREALVHGFEATEEIAWLERLLALEPRLPDVLAGKAMPGDAAERIDLAELCYYRSHYVASARLFLDAFADDAKLATPTNCHNAACSAALAATQGAKDASRWRRLALGWLRTNLAAREGQVEATPDGVALAMESWKRDSDFASVRDRIDELPEGERAEWRKLWADVDALLARVREKHR